MIKNIVNGYKVIEIDLEGANCIFTTSHNGLDLNREGIDFQKNLNCFKDYYKLNDIAYLKQIHSTYVYDANSKEDIGDGLYTEKMNLGIAVFTADCVPILVYDYENNLIAALHSGWKGTVDNILKEGIKFLIQKGGNPKTMKIVIGPHNKSCCYEIGNDVVEKFNEKDIFKGVSIFKGRNLDMEKAIILQALNEGVLKENIITMEYCTFCSSDVKFHSYRRDREQSGRMFSFIYMK